MLPEVDTVATFLHCHNNKQLTRARLLLPEIGNAVAIEGQMFQLCPNAGCSFLTGVLKLFQIVLCWSKTVDMRSYLLFFFISCNVLC